MTSAAAGLGALGFWVFIASIVVAGIWYDARRRESQQETLRRIVESGRDLSPETIDRLTSGGESRNLERDLRVSALITLSVAPGLAVLALFLGKISEEALWAVLGASLLAGFVGAGLYLAARLVERRYAGRPD